MTKYKEWENVGKFDVLVGGTPCQSFSVAGLRKGLDDPRGNLMLVYGAMADHFKPTFIVWENVPGVLSTNGGDDFRSFLDMLEYIGYVVDVDILDAQFHGVPQRRRRVFVCGRRIEDILNKRTNTSSLIIIQLLQEISRTILTVALHQSGNAPQSSDKLNRLNDGLWRRMKLFGLVGEKDNSTMLQENLIDVYQKHLQELKNSDAGRGEYERALIQEGQLTDSQTGSPCTLTEQSLSEVLGESLKVAKSYITSTATKTITTSEIYLFSKLVLLTGKLIVLSNKSSPSLWSAASSSLTSLREYINYARQTNSDLFGDLERIHYWDDFIGEAVRLQEFIGSIGVENFGKVLPITEGLLGNPPPSREAGKGTSRGVEIGPSGGSFTDLNPTLDARCKDGPVRNQLAGAVMCFEPRSPDGHARVVAGGIAPTLNRMGGGQREPCIFTTVVMATGQGNAEITEGHAPTLNCNHEAPILATSSVRRLTPRECERLQGFTEERKTFILSPCVEEKKEIAPSVDQSSQAPNQGGKERVLVNVLIDFDLQRLQLHKAGKLLLSASFADAKSSFLRYTQGEDFARLIALMKQEGDKIITTGKVASPRVNVLSSHRPNGSIFANLYGLETEELASGAGPFMSGAIEHLKSITSQAGKSSLTLEQKFLTLSFFVASAINGFIQEKTQTENISPIRVETVCGWTMIPWRGARAENCPDGPRYKACGNSMAVPVMRWIGERITANTPSW